MILGNSKAGQNLIPSIINSKIQKVFDEPLYNFSFSLYDSPYGELYTQIIKRKLKKNAGKSLFIVTVDPWAISGPKGSPNDPSTFEESKKYLRDVLLVDIKPNPFFFYKHFEKSFYEVLIQRLKPGKTIIHNDGWWETEDFTDSLIVLERTNHLIKSYTEYAKMHEFSDNRLSALSNLLKTLKEKGDVVILRLPLTEPIFEIENRAIPDFNIMMNEISISNNIPYLDLNFLANELFFEDGLHLDKKSSSVLSSYIGDWIISKYSEEND